MRNVMKKAWEIAREGQRKFGGKVKEYFAEALKMAWAMVKTVTVKTTSGSRKYKSWVAKITGTHPKWKLNREFIEAVEEDSWIGKVFELNAGIYEVCNAGDREFIHVENGEIEYIAYADVLGMVV